MHRRIWLAGLATLVVLLGVNCDAQSDSRAHDLASAQRYGPRDLTRPQRYGGLYVGGTATGDTRAGAAFARWVPEQDPGRRYITDTVVRSEQTPGAKVQPIATNGELQQLPVALAKRMARTFPGKPLVVNAFYRSGHRLAEAVYNPRTGFADVRLI